MSQTVTLKSKYSKLRYTRQAGEEPIEGYPLLEPLGTGGFAEVWKCVAPGGLCKAMKIVTVPPSLEPGQVSPTQHEWSAFKRVREIRHPYLISIDRVDERDGELLIVMELADSSLQDQFDYYRKAGRPGIPEDQMLHYLLEAAEILDVMNFHHGLQHLDVKPANLLLLNRHLKLADFGLVSRNCEQVVEGQQSIAGCCTPRYASPELLQGTISAQCDQYSLAIVYQELLTGTMPFSGNSLLKRLMRSPDLNSLPDADRPIVAKALSPKPEHRFGSCLEFIHALLESKAETKGSRFFRVMSFSSLTPSDSVCSNPEKRAKPTEPAFRDESMHDTPTQQNRPLRIAARLDAEQAETPRHDTRPNVPLLSVKAPEPTSTPSSNDEVIEFPSSFGDVIYPPTIHVSDMGWKPGGPGGIAPGLDKFIGQLLAVHTKHGGKMAPANTYRELPGDVLEDTFFVPAVPMTVLRQRFERTVRECHGEELVRSERFVEFAVEGQMPFWRVFSSRQRIMKATVKVDASKQANAEFCKVTARIEPLHPEGPELEPSLRDVRALLLKNIRSVMEAATERRQNERWPCNFGVSLYPVLGNWRFGTPIEAMAVDLSTQGIGLNSSALPSSTRVYLRPKASSSLTDFAILTEIVRNRTLADGTLILGARLGQI